jgi:hypothetical protein
MSLLQARNNAVRDVLTARAQRETLYHDVENVPPRYYRLTTSSTEAVPDLITSSFSSSHRRNPKNAGMLTRAHAHTAMYEDD